VKLPEGVTEEQARQRCVEVFAALGSGPAR